MRRPARQAREGHGPHTLRVWKGTIVGFGGGDDVFVELGPRMQGVISRGAFETEPVIGDVHEFTLRGQEESLWVLSLREARSLSTWENMEAGSVVQARAIRVNRGGLELKIGPLHAFMPKSQTGLDREQPLEILVGKTMVCEVSEVDRERQRVLLSRKAVLRRERESERKRELGSLAPGQVVQGRVSRIESYGVFVRFGRGLEGLIHVSDLSHERVQNPADLVKCGDAINAKVLSIKKSGRRIALGLKQMQASPWTDLERHHYVDQILEGVVMRVKGFGAFVAIRPGVEGLLHRSQTGYAEDANIRQHLRPGQRLALRIEALDVASERLSLSLLHRNGARIEPEDVVSAQTFEEFAQAFLASPVQTNLGEVLSGAMRRTGPRAC